MTQATPNPEAIAELLREAIRRKVFLPGAALAQEELAARFGVSRSPVREALRTLAGEGVVVLQPGEGATVRRLSRADLEEIYDLRLALEPLIAPHVMAERSARDVASLEAIARRTEEAETVEAWIRSNFELHRAIYALVGRPRTESILLGLLSAVQPYSERNIAQLGGRAQADREHRELVDALRDGDAERFAEVLETHVRAAKDRVAAADDAEGAEADPVDLLRG